MRVLLPLLAAGAAFAFGACDSRQENVREEALETRAEALEEKARAVEKTADSQAETLQKEAERTRQQKSP